MPAGVDAGPERQGGAPPLPDLQGGPRARRGDGGRSVSVGLFPPPPPSSLTPPSATVAAALERTARLARALDERFYAPAAGVAAGVSAEVVAHPYPYPAYLAGGGAFASRGRGADGATLLHLAAATGDPDVIRRLAARGCGVRARTRWGCSPLHAAARSGASAAAASLLRLGASPDDADLTGETPLFAAVRRQDLATASLLLSAGADPEAVNAAETTVVHAAAGRCRCPALLGRLSEGWPALDRVDSSGETALHVPCRASNAPFVWALGHQLSPALRDAENHAGHTPGDIAAARSPATAAALAAVWS
ncbi:ankyrin repeat-containing domain protein [Tribonema minus]|uniref:Ankyrin repeat-containing domain protein n=1 Tax=Tribonema minus TaxID=303371 RepID=A0A835Z126_9STRA|nr:ankyrin repeat-containing domain protein [Tribonema minus]